MISLKFTRWGLTSWTGATFSMSLRDFCGKCESLEEFVEAQSNPGTLHAFSSQNISLQLTSSPERPEVFNQEGRWQIEIRLFVKTNHSLGLWRHSQQQHSHLCNPQFSENELRLRTSEDSCCAARFGPTDQRWLDKLHFLWKRTGFQDVSLEDQAQIPI